MNFWIIFLTGLTTGGLSCMAVQGGLLATVMTDSEHGHTARSAPAKTIGLFLAAKLVAYTALGFLLGWLGTVIQLSSTTRGIIQLLVAIFLIGTALRMLNVHPIFRYFAVRPPKALTRWLRRFSKDGGDDTATPVFLGVLTVLVPCGVTQAMMALALSTSNPWQGALLMASFTLGTMPIFFGLSYLATKLGQTLQHRFTLVAALLILALGLYSIEGGLNVLGSPLSIAAVRQNFSASSEQPVAVTQPSTSPAASAEPKPEATTTEPTPPRTTELTINVSSSGYEPKSVKAPADAPLKVTFVAKDAYSCASAIVFPSLDKNIFLKSTDTQTLELPAQKAGTTLRYTCAMGMYTGSITFG